VPGRRSVTGLGAALDIARNTERCLTPAHLPLDFDSVLKAVRNNLIHLSGDALATPLQEFDDQLAGGGFTLRHFLEREDMLLDFVTTIPRFVNEQYLQLRRDGKLI
jgi:hypothetical protein